MTLLPVCATTYNFPLKNSMVFKLFKNKFGWKVERTNFSSSTQTRFGDSDFALLGRDSWFFFLRKSQNLKLVPPTLSGPAAPASPLFVQGAWNPYLPENQACDEMTGFSPHCLVETNYHIMFFFYFLMRLRSKWRCLPYPTLSQTQSLSTFRPCEMGLLAIFPAIQLW